MPNQINLLKRIIMTDGTPDLCVDLHEIETMITKTLPDELEKNAPPNFPELYFDFKQEYERFKEFILFDKLIGRNVVALGGGFSSGSLDIDNQRCVALAELSSCLVVSVDYRLVSEQVHFPEPLLDCWTAFHWLREHAGELEGDPERIGIHGTSAGGCLSAGLALYLRDRGEKAPALTVLSCPTLDNVNTPSKIRYGQLKSGENPYPQIGYVMYANLNSGQLPPYYALPGRCEDLRKLGPHMVVVAEYDPLRDEGLRYALRLLENGVPCELLSAPRVAHGFCAMPHPLTEWVHRGIAASFRREFGLPVGDISSE